MTQTRRGSLCHVGVVYPWDCDYMGHMNVRAYVDRFDQSSWALWGTVGLDRRYFEEQRRNMAAVEQRLSYHKELRAGDTFRVSSWFEGLGQSSVRMVHELEAGGEVAARCEFVVVHLDADTRRPVRLEGAIRSRILASLAVDDAPEEPHA